MTVSVKTGHVRHLFKTFRLKLPAFARTRPLLFSRTGLSNLLNKILFTFEVVPCLISKVCINFSPVLFKGWVGGRRGGVGEGGGWGGRRLKLPR